VRGVDDGVGLDVLDDAPAEEKRFVFGGGGRRLVTTFQSAVETVSHAALIKYESPTVERISKPGAGTEVSPLTMRRRFFFLERRAKALSLKAGAMMTSLKISAMSCAVARSSGRLRR